MSNRLPKPSGLQSRYPDLARIFKPVEHAVLAKYLSLPGLLPGWAEEIDLDNFPEDEWDEAAQGIAPRELIGDHNVLENTVARIALAPVQNELPQWAAFDSDQTILARTVREFPERDATSRPLLLFGINWATSGPGFSWPEDYYVTWIPHYDRYIVTASADSCDVHGFEDIAIGFFKGSADKGGDQEAIKEIIIGYWGETSEVQTAWEDYWRSGAVDSETAWSWRNEVWSTEENKDDEGEES